MELLKEGSFTRNPVRLALGCLSLGLLFACGGDEGAGEEGASEVSLPEAREVTGAELGALGTPGCAKGFDLLVITIDTLRADRLGCTGYSKASTPVIDGLAGHAVRFDQAFAPAPITLPSHSTIFTGLDVPNHGVRNNGTFSLTANRETLAEQLKGAGYRTAAFVGAYVLDERYGLNQGFDHYDDAVNPRDSARRSSHFNERSANQVTDAALAWMKSELPKGGDAPCFTWLHYFDVHHPYEAPGEFGTRFRSSPYDGEIAFVDFQIGRVLEHLKSIGRLERTLCVITSDHGEGLGEHSEETHSRLLYDSTLRVPLILSNAALFSEGLVVRDRVAGLVDLAPTLLGLLGVESSAAFDGVDLFQAEADDERALYVETLVPLFNHGWAPLQGLHRLGDKFISAPRPEFYDTRHDPGEAYNLYPESPPAAAPLEKDLRRRQLADGSVADLLSSEKAMDPEQAQRLAALGYTRSPGGSGAVGQLDPKDMMPVFQQIMEARSLTDAGRHGEAMAKNEQVLAQNPNDAYAWETASLIHARAGRMREAENALVRLMKIQPTAEGYVRLAQMQLKRQDLAGMQNSMALAEALDPMEGGVHMVAGDAYAMQGRFAEARAAFEKALQIDPVKWGAMAKDNLRRLKSQ